MLLSVTPNKMEAINTLTDATNQMDDDFCICFLDNQGVLKTLFIEFPLYTVPAVITLLLLPILLRAWCSVVY